MRIDDETRSEEPALNLTPMIDVVFLLLIFFMVATTFLDPEREIGLDLPEAQSGEAGDASTDEIVINVLRDGTLSLGATPVDQPTLVDRLKAVARRDPETPVTIRGDREAHHERIVTVMDACGVAGLRNLAVGTLEGS